MAAPRGDTLRPWSDTSLMRPPLNYAMLRIRGDVRRANPSRVHPMPASAAGPESIEVLRHLCTVRP